MHPSMGYTRDMDVKDRPVIVDAGRLDDLLELAARAVRALEAADPRLADAIRGSAAEVRESTIPEP